VNGYKNAVDDVASRFESIEVLVNNAGVTADGLLLMMSYKIGTRW